MKEIEINIPLTNRNSKFNFDEKVLISNFRIITSNQVYINQLQLVARFYLGSNLVRTIPIISNDNMAIQSDNKIESILVDKLVIESNANKDFSILGLFNFIN